MVILRLSLSSYTWRRTVATEGGIATEWMQAHSGVAPGSAFAVYELKLALFSTAILHVDDSALRFVGESKEEVVEAAIVVEIRVRGRLKLIGMDLAEEKEQIL